MIFDYFARRLVSTGACCFPDLRLLRPGAVLRAAQFAPVLLKAHHHDRHWLVQIILFCAASIVALVKPLGLVHDALSMASVHSVADAAAGRRPGSTGSAASTRGASSIG